MATADGAGLDRLGPVRRRLAEMERAEQRASTAMWVAILAMTFARVALPSVGHAVPSWLVWAIAGGLCIRSTAGHARYRYTHTRRARRRPEACDLLRAEVTYEERQPLQRHSLMLLLTMPLVTLWIAWAVWSLHPGDWRQGLIAVVIGAVGVAWVLALWPPVCRAMRTSVSERLVIVRHRLLRGRERVPTRWIRSCRVVDYPPDRQARGQGRALTPFGLHAFRASGRRGVLLDVEDAWPVLVGSEEPERLAEAIAATGAARLPEGTLAAAMGWDDDEHV
jgi:hypothetical protein